jgi:hypothetical protein
MSGCSAGAVLCLRSGVDLTIGHIANSGVPLPRLRPRHCTICYVAGPLPRHRLPERDCERATFVLEVLLHGRRTTGGDLAIDCPDKGGELACDRRHRDGLKLAFPGQCPIARAQAALRLPGDLTNGSRRRRHLLLLLLSHSRRMLIAPGTLHQNAARSTVARLGDRAALDRIPGRASED